MKKSIGNTIKNIIIIIFILALAFTFIFIPGIILNKNSRVDLGIISMVPAAYYSGPSEVVIRNASKQLTDEQCVQLITGIWESTISRADSEECRLTEYSAKIMATDLVNDLYKKGEYPATVASDYEQWYSWSATPYRALDTTFRTYAAFFWDIRFIKYDGSETHRVIMTEEGTLLYINSNLPDSEKYFSTFTAETLALIPDQQ